MPKKLFDDDADDLELKTDNEYAKNYNTWRKKEELHKLKARYGEDAADMNSDLSSSSDDDETGVELTEEIEKKFFKTLSCLKNKDPRIYDKNVRFFDESDVIEQHKKKEKKERPLFIKDYERKLILERGGQISDSDGEEDEAPRSPTYVEEQYQLKHKLKKALDDVDEEDDGEWGGMFKTRQKTAAEKKKEEADYKKWLAGQKVELNDKEAEKELKPLKDYWNNPKLGEGEKFLKDYLLNKRYLEDEDADYVPTYDEIVHDSDEGLSEDENEIVKQEEFEHKYNFRFEEPDQEFIKRYPRTMENSVRKKDDKRKIKRAEIKERKQKEKQQMKEELKKLQELHRKELEEKIQKLKGVTGNTDMQFNEEDIDGDFDPEAHDRRMQSLFNDEFYAGPEGDQKPEFPDLDEELELERWDKWNGEESNAPYADREEESSYHEPHCEDEDFNMDCDYDPNNLQKELIENTKGRKKRRRKSKFAKMISEPRPPFNPHDKSYQEYIDEYYKFDCEDIIGDIPCKFKYRQVVPNSFGLSIEEILLAKDRELNRWCSLKKAVQYRPENQEKYDQITYERKGQNLDLKKKIFTSLFEPDENEKEKVNNQQMKNKNLSNDSKKSKKKKINELSFQESKDEVLNESATINEEVGIIDQQAGNELTNSKKKKKKRKNLVDRKNCETAEEINNEILNQNNDEIQEETTKSKKKKKSTNPVEGRTCEVVEEIKNETVNGKGNNRIQGETSKPKKKRKNKQNIETMHKVVEDNKNESQIESHESSKKRKKRNNKQGAAGVPASENQVSSENTNNTNKFSKNRKRKLNANNEEVAFKKQKRFNNKKKSDVDIGISDARLSAYGINAKKFKNKLKYGDKSK